MTLFEVFKALLFAGGTAIMIQVILRDIQIMGRKAESSFIMVGFTFLGLFLLMVWVYAEFGGF